MKYPSPYSWPRACIACGHTDKYQKLFLTSFSIGDSVSKIEMLEIPAEICDRCHASTMKEIDEVRRLAKPDTLRMIQIGKYGLAAVSILSIILGVITYSILVGLFAFSLGTVVIVYETFRRIQKQEAKFNASMKEVENPVYRHLRVYH